MANQYRRYIDYTPTGTRPPTEAERESWTNTNARWNWLQNPDLIARHVFETDDQALITSWKQKGLSLGQTMVEWHKGKSTMALGGNKDKWVIMTIFRNLLLELENLGKHGLGERCFLVQILP